MLRKVSYYVYDRLGSVVGLVDTKGKLVTQYVYDPWGNIIGGRDGGIENPFRYTGREWDNESGLYYYRARYYDPEVGRFISRDPIAFAGGSNFYTYVGNNPVNRRDSLGLLFGGLIDAGEDYGQYAAEWYAERSINPNNAWWETALYTAGGLLASLWTPCTSDDTFTVLSTAWGSGATLERGLSSTSRFKDNVFRWGYERWKYRGNWVNWFKRWHFHIGPKELMRYHLPWETKQWLYNARSIVRRFLK